MLLCATDRFEDLHERNTPGAGGETAPGTATGSATRDDHAPAYTRKLLQGDQARSTYLSGRVRQASRVLNREC